jgi:hypothetical protein
MKTLSTIWLVMAFACIVLQVMLDEPLFSFYCMGCVLASSIYNVGHKLQAGEK